MTLKEEFSSRIAAAKLVIDQLVSSKSEIQHGLNKQQGWLAQFHEYENVTAISRRLVVSLVERINVYEGSEIEVVSGIGINLLISKSFWKAKRRKLKNFRYCQNWRWCKWLVYPARMAASIRLAMKRRIFSVQRFIFAFLWRITGKRCGFTG